MCEYDELQLRVCIHFVPLCVQAPVRLGANLPEVFAVKARGVKLCPDMVFPKRTESVFLLGLVARGGRGKFKGGSPLGMVPLSFRGFNGGDFRFPSRIPVEGLIGASPFICCS